MTGTPEGDVERQDPRWRWARRSALDHVLSIIAESTCFDSLVLRGSMTMLAWVPDAAREPGDIDWVVRPIAGVPLDELDPYPYLDRLDSVQLWPEIAHGAGHGQMWEFEDFDTGGMRAHVPPEGLRWVQPEDFAAQERPHREVIALICEHPRTPGGVVLDGEAVTEDAAWAYAYSGPDSDSRDEGGARLSVPWRVDGGVTGSLQLDFAYDETLPEPAVLTAIPRADGQGPVALWTATRSLSLAWKLLWLGTDQATQGHCAGKDLYDAVLLAEGEGVQLSPRLNRTVVARTPDPDVLRPDAVRAWNVDWSDFAAAGPSSEWLDRLASALESTS